MEQEIRTLIKALNPGLPVNFGVNPAGSAYPACVLNVISSPGTHNMDGRDGLTQSRVQIDIYATTYGEMASTRDSVISGIDGYQGDRIHRVFYSDASQTIENEKQRSRLTFFVWHS
ncbi:hypothetical protein IQ24_00367 [Paracoccus sulfuroxidans]|uniref:DUF3168 domain-containing protein n=1 Tax=Paracoccus sulfuroxidans TaxID=384678 RepID=A0A562P1F0_9RHOB|nr:hypothetical protein IQ24_00367 [Paracoccus sulfuroxidans]